MKARGALPLKFFLLEMAIYSPLVVAYLLLVLGWLNEAVFLLYQENLRLYAVAAVLLVLGQALVLEIITSGLVRWLHGRRGG